LREGGAASDGLTLSDALLESYAAWRAGTADAAQLEQQLAAEMPWAPLLWRSGTLYYAKALEGFTPSASSVFYGLEQLRLA
jgi:ABC-type transport system substrate-binding protein